MQFMMKLFEVTPQGLGGPAGMQKVAVKMPTDGKLGGAEGDAQFADIMAALFSMPAEQLEASLANLDKIEMGEASTELVPVIDLAQLIDDKMAMYGVGDAQSDVKAEASALSADGGLANTDLSEMIARFIGPENSNKSEKGAGLSSAVHRIDLERVLGRQTQAETESATTPKEAGIVIAEENGASLRHQFQAGNMTAQTAREKAVAFDPKSAADKLSEKSQDVEGESTEEAESKFPTDNGAKFGAAARTLAHARSGMAHHSPGQAQVASQEGNRSTASTAQETAEVETNLSDADLKQRIKPQEPRENAAPLTNAGQATSSTTTNTVSVESQQSVTAPSSEVADGKIKIHPNQEDPEVPTSSKEMETDIIRQIVQRMTLRTDGRQSHMQIRLKPEFLGNLKMDVVTENAMVMVRMTAESQSVKEMIEQNIGLLKTELQQQGLQVQKVDVTVSQDNDQLSGGQQQAAFDQTRQRSGRRQGNRHKSEGGSQETGGSVNPAETATVTQSRSSEVDFFA